MRRSCFLLFSSHSISTSTETSLRRHTSENTSGRIENRVRYMLDESHCMCCRSVFRIQPYRTLTPLFGWGGEKVAAARGLLMESIRCIEERSLVKVTHYRFKMRRREGVALFIMHGSDC